MCLKVMKDGGRKDKGLVCMGEQVVVIRWVRWEDFAGDEVFQEWMSGSCVQGRESGGACQGSSEFPGAECRAEAVGRG